MAHRHSHRNPSADGVPTSVLTKVPAGIFLWNFPGIFRNFSSEFSRNFPKISNVLKRGDSIRNFNVGGGVYKLVRHFIVYFSVVYGQLTRTSCLFGYYSRIGWMAAKRPVGQNTRVWCFLSWTFWCAPFCRNQVHVFVVHFISTKRRTLSHVWEQFSTWCVENCTWWNGSCLLSK